MIFSICMCIGLLIVCISDLVSNKEITLSTVVGIFAAICIIIAMVLLLGEPEAIDVYRGKTTLEITYKDGVAIDSVVVFK